jgi:Spy/CpxP family protein refolding chaperone
MKTTFGLGLLAAAAACLLASSPSTLAQQPPGGGGGAGGGAGGGGGQGQRGNRGNFDPAQMQERMMARYKEMLEITADDEWKAIEPLVAKINEARRDVSFGGMARMMRPPGGGGPGGQGGPGGGGRRGFGGEPAPEEEALQKAVDSKSGSAELKAAMAKMREARKAKEAKLATAQDNLRQVLTARQEAQAMLAGLLN